MELTLLRDEELLGGVATLLGAERELCAKLLAHFAEIEARKLHLKAGFSSMFQLCVEHHGMSEGQAFRRILAARLARRFPIIYSLVASGAVHLSALQLLHEHLTEANHRELLQEASGQRKHEIEVWLARRFPKPDVPSRIRKLPQRKTAPTPVQAADGLAPQPELRLARAAPARLQPPSEGRFKVEFTASSSLREKLARSFDLMSHANPTRDLATVVERALDVLLERLEKTRLGALKHPKSSRKKRAGARKSSTGIPRAVRREVFERDGEQCRSNARTSRPMGGVAPRVPFWSSTTSSHALRAAATRSKTCACVAMPTTSSGQSRRMGPSTLPRVGTFASKSRWRRGPDTTC